MLQFSLFYYKVIVYDLCQNFITAQYLEKKMTEFDLTLHMH